MKLNKMLVLIVVAGIARDLAHAQTWAQAANAPSAHWASIACSADGSKLVAGNLNFYSNQSYFVWDGSIYISTNFGASWIQSTNAPPAGWISVASSADGNSLVAVAVGGSVYVSKDSGTTWIWG